MLSQAVEARPELTSEHHQAAAIDLLTAARADWDRAVRGRNRTVLAAAKYLSKRRIAEVTGWDRGTVARIIAAAE